MPVGYCALRVLNRMGVKSESAKGYESQFGVNLRMQKPLEIGGGVHALMAEPTDANTPMDSIFGTSMQYLLTEARNTLGLNQGEFAMFVLDQPDMPPSMPTIMVAEKANLGQQLVAGRLSTLGVCEILNLNRSSQVDVYSTIVANMYFNTYKAKIDAETAIVRVIRQPAHGSLEPNPGWNEARYVPNDGYIGKDFFILEVEGNGYKVRLQYFLLVTADDGEVNNPACKTPGQIPGHWKISLNPAPDYTSDIQPLLTYTGISGSVAVDIAVLPGTAVARVGRNNQRALRRTKNPPILAPCLTIDAPGTRAAPIFSL
ncbi:MAG: hypothetical protein Q8K01_00830, partial [Sulfurimicrobium sp.]|nr:hypothetical protein [Sulfurimicrobium sp.]